jgi:hypothetical protein
MNDVNFCWTQIRKKALMNTLKCKLTGAPMSEGKKSIEFPVQLYGKIEDNYHLANKKALFLNMKNYYEAMNKDPFTHLPVTFHIKNGVNDAEFANFKAYFDSQDGNIAHNAWIIKPGENTNCGHGIQVSKEYYEIKSLITDATQGGNHTCIVQKYITKPLLIHRRKFDIRTYAVLTSTNGNLKGYTYEEGYIRTSCLPFSMKDLENRAMHLTNDAIQKHQEDYGKYEPGNKMSYSDFQRYLDKSYPNLNVCFDRDILP